MAGSGLEGSPSPSGRPAWWPVFAIGALALASWARAPGGVAAGAKQPVAAAAPQPSPAPSDGAGERNRGREATNPTEIPLLGWKDIAWRTYQGINDDRLLAVAAGVTFYALLAIFPAVAALVSLYGLVADPAQIGKQLDALNGILPDGAVSIIGDQVKRLASTPGGSLSFALVTSLAISLWSANAGMKAIFDALNVAYREKEKRSFVALNLRSLAFTVGAILILVLAMASVVVLPAMLNFIGFSGVVSVVLAVTRWPLLLAILILALSVLYRYGPSRAVAKWRWIGWGSGLAAVLWIAASMLFSFYVSKFGSYNATYGSLGSAVGFMTWMWISTIVVLIGAEVSGEMEHQTK